MSKVGPSVHQREDESKPSFRSGHTLISKGPRMHSPKGGHLVDMNKMEGQRWS